MEDLELKNILIEELGSMPFKDKKIIKEGGNIPDDLLEKLIHKNEKKRKFSKIMLTILLILLLVTLFLNYFLDTDRLTFMLFGSIVMMQIPQLIFHPDYKDNSKKDLIYRLFKHFQSKEKLPNS